MTHKIYGGVRFATISLNISRKSRSSAVGPSLTMSGHRAATAYDLGLFNKSKLQSLPVALQSELKTVSPEHFRLLLSSVCQCHHFDFFGLPGELRNNILEALFTTKTGRVRPRDAGCKPLYGLGILRTNRALHTEALAALHKVNTVVWTFDGGKKLPTSESKLHQYVESITSFFRVELRIVLYQLWVDLEQTFEDEPNGIVKRLIGSIQSAVHNRHAKSDINVHIVFSTAHHRVSDTILSDYETKYSKAGLALLGLDHDEAEPYLAGFLRLQLQEMLSDYDHALARLPKLKITTNVDNADVENGIIWLNDDYYYAVFKDMTSRKMGMVFVDRHIAKPEDGTWILIALRYDADMPLDDISSIDDSELDYF